MISCHLVDTLQAPVAPKAKVKLLAVPRPGERVVVTMHDGVLRHFAVNAVGYLCEDASHAQLNSPLESFVLLEVSELGPS